MSVSIIICPLGNLDNHYLGRLESISQAYYVSPDTLLVRFDDSQEVVRDHFLLLLLIRHLTQMCDKQVAKSEFHPQP